MNCIAVGYNIDYSILKNTFNQIIPNIGDKVLNWNTYTGIKYSSNCKYGPNEIGTVKELENWYNKRKMHMNRISVKKCWVSKTNDVIILQLQINNDCFYSFPVNINNKATTQQKKLLTTSDQFIEIDLKKFDMPMITGLAYIHYIENGKNVIITE